MSPFLCAGALTGLAPQGVGNFDLHRREHGSNALGEARTEYDDRVAAQGGSATEPEGPRCADVEPRADINEPRMRTYNEVCTARTYSICCWQLSAYKSSLILNSYAHIIISNPAHFSAPSPLTDFSSQGFYHNDLHRREHGSSALGEARTEYDKRLEAGESSTQPMAPDVYEEREKLDDDDLPETGVTGKVK